MSESVSYWILRILGIEAKPGEGATFTWLYEWSLPLWVSVLLLIAAEAVFLTFYFLENSRVPRWYRFLLAQIRVAAILIIFFMLAGTGLGIYRTGLPFLPVVVDDSLSMTAADYFDEPTLARIRESFPGMIDAPLTRWQVVQQLTLGKESSLLAELARSYRLRFFTISDQFGGGLDKIDAFREWIGQAEPRAESSRLGLSVRNILEQFRATTPAAIVLVTDGINTDGIGLVEASQVARLKGVPLVFVALGADSPIVDLEIGDLLAEDLVFVNDLVTFQCVLQARGAKGRKVQIKLRSADDGTVLAHAEQVIPEDQWREQVRLAYRPMQSGTWRYILEAEALPEERNAENNRLEKAVSVVEHKIRVLLAAGYPSWEYRYLRNLLQRDETIALRTVVQDADPAHTGQDAVALPGFPVRRDELAGYDVVMLMDFDPSGLSASVVQNILDFVDPPASQGRSKGGALILVAGPRYLPRSYWNTPLSRLLPVEPPSTTLSASAFTEAFRLRPTQLGLGSAGLQLGDTAEETVAIWQQLPPLYWFYPLGTPKAGARVLAEHPFRAMPDGNPFPLILIQYIGSGVVWMQATDETWRWRFRIGDFLFARYWVQTIRFLARSKLVGEATGARLTADRREYRLGESVMLRLQFAETRQAPASDQVEVLLSVGARAPQPFALRRSGTERGLFEGTLLRPTIGNYRVWYPATGIEGQMPETYFRVSAPVGEFERLAPDFAAMHAAAKNTGGLVLDMFQAQDLPRVLPPGRAVPVEPLPPKSLWNWWPVLATFLLILTGEWILRKLGGMM